VTGALLLQRSVPHQKVSIPARYEKHFETSESHNTRADTRAPVYQGSVRLPGAATYSPDVVAFGIILFVSLWSILGDDTMSGNTNINSIGRKNFMSLLVFVRYLLLRALDQRLDRSS
jgi:hypothetical protein